MVGMFMILIVVMVSLVYAHVQIQQIAHIKCVQFLYISYTSIKLFQKSKNKYFNLKHEKQKNDKKIGNRYNRTPSKNNIHLSNT